LKQYQLDDFFKAQKKSLGYFFDHVDLKNAEKLLELLSKVKGTIFFTGVGKSGFIAQKITASFVSLGIKAHFLSPVDALHGDLGIIDKEDLLVFFSKSGESEEILNLIPFVRNREVKLVALVSEVNSRLAKASDFVMTLPMDKELCPHNIVPTTSTEIQLIFGDILTVALMQKKELTLDEFALNHPGGKIGKRLSIRVKDLMLTGKQLPFCHPEDKLMEVLNELSEKRCGCLLIVNDRHHLQGIFTDGDLRRALETHGPKVFDLKLSDLQTSQPKMIQPLKLAWEAMQMMESDQKRPVMVLPVVDEENVVKGLIKMHDILQSGLG